ncbi:MAG TPA: hypothetical protein VFK54_13730 [Candidatus Limnocylindrales bacterium]|nr:hypothetical protein [Candidatus Limnocylindrales bacterium]
MAINALRGTSKATEAPVIGDPDGAIFVCTSCARPVASGARSCPGCGARFLLDVPIRRAAALASMGLALGLVVGGGGVGLAAALGSAPAATAVTPSAAPDPLPSALPVATQPSSGGGSTSGVPPAAVAALRGTTTINTRIALLAQPLAAELAAEDLDVSAVARTLRRVALEVGAAETLVPSLRAWPTASLYAGDLDRFYESLATRVREGLGASVRNEEAYRVTATDVLALLGGLPALDAAAHQLAAEADLPPAATP